MTPVRHMSATPETLATEHAACFSDRDRWSATSFAALLEQPEVDGFHVAGAFVLMRVVLDEAEILTVCTVPEKRRQGLAAKLVGKALDEAQARGAVKAFLEVEESNAAALGLYQGFGFAEVGRRKDYYGQGRTALVLRKSFNNTP